MTYNYTDLLLVKHLYNELDSREKREVEAALVTDSDLKETYQLLVKRKAELPNIQFAPPSETINNILGYSAQTALEAQF